MNVALTFQAQIVKFRAQNKGVMIRTHNHHNERIYMFQEESVKQERSMMMARYLTQIASLSPSSSSSLTCSSSNTSRPFRTPHLQQPPKTLSCHLSSSHNNNNIITSKPLHFALSAALSLGFFFGGIGAAEGAKVGVNKPELLPKDFTTVIDVAGFLSDGQEKRLAQEIADLENETGYKLRVLAQNYPDTPGLAIKDFWQVDDRTVVFVADPTFGNILNFNVGASVDLDIPRSFWSRLAGKYGNIFYWKEKGEDASIEAAVMAISNCLREPVGPNNCSEVK
ncbi:thylakoid lumenal 15.0 kDa protein 2, chloroplastic [Arachis duranensis]|uniref:Thylakoid lumenal 15.0 kDa protein 2, chloroplastic n=1 Tax=Arachis duranensis TaxID=130453 RepID=A0A6P4CHE7_ARADU|nr:thylakoid lumenal 15.0 kDa protein 2, chloroplastic [Arachis duranensis]